MAYPHEVTVQITETPGPQDKGGLAVEAVITADRPQGPPHLYTTITMHDLPAAQRAGFIERKARELWGLQGDIVVKGL